MAYPLTLVSDWELSTKTAIEKFQELPFFAKEGGHFNRKNHVARLEAKGYKYSDNPEIGWFIVVDFQVYLLKELTRRQFLDPYDTLGDASPDNEPFLLNKTVQPTEPPGDPEKDPGKTNPPGGSGNENSDAAPGSFIQGVSNNTLYAVAGFLVLVIVLISSKKWLR